MFDKFTDRARKVCLLAKQEAERFGHEYISTEHLLLGLRKEGSGLASHVLSDAGFDLSNLRLALEKFVPCPVPKPSSQGKMPLTPGWNQAMEFAIEEAKKLGHKYIGTEHLLLGLLRVAGDTDAGEMLAHLGAKPEALRERVMEWLGTEGSVPSPGAQVNSLDFSRFTDRARLAMRLAHQDATRLNALGVGSENILAGVLQEGDGLGCVLLRAMGIDCDALLKKVQVIQIGGEQFVTLGRLPYSPRAKLVLEHAIAFERQLSSGLGTRHLLIGMLLVPESTAAVLLADAGVTVEKMQQTMQAVGRLIRLPPSLEKLTQQLIATAMLQDPEGKSSYDQGVIELAKRVRDMLAATGGEA